MKFPIATMLYWSRVRIKCASREPLNSDRSGRFQVDWDENDILTISEASWARGEDYGARYIGARVVRITGLELIIMANAFRGGTEYEPVAIVCTGPVSREVAGSGYDGYNCRRCRMFVDGYDALPCNHR